ncbi:MAG: discoidin domain-containing protein [candidate division KSB1 bacterium]|nr:discoidin domain-containing protein [candidate division KSB1 bacterium]MDZ7273821.1 discoidin domain-containing protein [candidate division KSB1 bacterium]MDZ7285977.1 discoidin domain-containing protein [candidate division KSB1 bacterium]MDZ7299009.1 discoidin domain-containing protein [candidate division KSB1 bacterium]MDZ7307978.1 discoidin domain-containing protein [candidate division KSB1 bacterium]
MGTLAQIYSKAGRLWLLLVLGGLHTNAVLHAQGTNTIVRSVILGSDDAGPEPGGCGFSTGDGNIYFGQCDNGREIVSGFRFQDVQIASPGEIQNAHLEFTVDGTYTNPLTLRFYGEAADNAATFSASSTPADRPLTTQFVEWAITEEWQWDTRRDGPDITAILKEIVGRPGWQAGNALSIIVKNVSAGGTHRRVYAYEREGSAKSAKLVINEPAPPSFDLYTQRPKVWVINFDPAIPSEGNRRLHAAWGWNDPDTLSAGYDADIEETSHGLVQYDIVKVINAGTFPVKEDGFRYTNGDRNTPGSYMYEWSDGDCDPPSGMTTVDYNAIVRDYDLARRLEAGEVDEVWLYGAPCFGYYESRMAGKGAYWCNAPEMQQVSASKMFVLMGFNYERGVGEMLHDYVHRTESIMQRVYGSWTNDSTHAWNRFTLYDGNWPNGAACGNAHFAPNSRSDYDYGNMTYVWSTHRDWLNNYPNLTNQKEWVNATEWGGGDMRLYHKWWFTHLPHMGGTATEYGMTRANNWWAYIQDFNSYPESGSTRASGYYSTPLRPEGVTQLTSNAVEDWAPQINDAGRMVWYGHDGNDYEIFAVNADGTNFVQITSNSIDDEYPRINAGNQVVWQAFDGSDYEIFTANADGSGLVQVTNNSHDDWHARINNAGRIVWDGWDGADYEIFSANVNGTDVVQLTNNHAASGYPREDTWPQINNAGRVVWMGHDGSNWEIFSANADGTGLLQLSSNTYNDEYAQINDANQVVWQSWHDNTNAEIHAASASGPTGSDIVLSSNLREDWHPRINNSGLVVWMGHNGNNWDIYRAGFDGSNRVQITSGPTDNQMPEIADNGILAWQAFDGSDWEIFVLQNGTIHQISSNTFDDRAPALSNHKVAWHGNSGMPNKSDVFVSNGTFSGITPPAAPSNLTATVVSGSQVDLSWTDNSNNEDGFKIERKTGASGTYAEIATVGANVTSYPDTGLAGGTTYYYRVRAYNAGGNSAYSNEASTTTASNPPAAPSNLTATAVSSSQINLNWTDNSANEDGFKIERKTGASGSYAVIATVGANVTSYANTGLVAGTTYYYRVFAYNTGGNSAYSNEANAMTPSGNTNLARNKPATASSYSSSKYAPEKANDGSTSSSWSSAKLGSSNQTQWWRVDLQAVQTVARVVIKWNGKYFAKNYQVQMSSDGVTWSTVYTDNAGNGGNDDFSFSPVSARYLRLYQTKPNKSYYRVNELEVYAGGSAALVKESAAEFTEAMIPDEIQLQQNYPNPFNPGTTITFSLPEAGHIVLKVYNLAGQEVARLAEGYYGRGVHRLHFEAGGLPSGIYFAVLQAGQQRLVQRMMFMK